MSDRQTDQHEQDRLRVRHVAVIALVMILAAATVFFAQHYYATASAAATL